MYSHPANPNTPLAAAAAQTDSGLNTYAVDPHNRDRRAYALPQGLPAPPPTIKPLYIAPLTTTDTFAAATWFTNTLLPAVQIHYSSDTAKNNNLKVITSYFVGHAKVVLDTWAKDQAANLDKDHAHIAIVAQWDDMGFPTHYTTWKQFRNWFFSAQGFGFQSAELATRSLEGICSDLQTDMKHY